MVLLIKVSYLSIRGFLTIERVSLMDDIDSGDETG